MEPKKLLEEFLRLTKDEAQRLRARKRRNAVPSATQNWTRTKIYVESVEVMLKNRPITLRMIQATRSSKRLYRTLLVASRMN